MANVDKEFFTVDESIKQNEIKDILSPEEEVLLTLKPDRRVYIAESILRGLPIALLWGGVDGFIIFTLIATNAFAEMGMMVGFIIGFFAIHLIPVWLYVAQVVKRVMGYKNLSYAFTDKRIIVRSGIVGIDFKFIYYTDIDSVNVKVGILDRLFKVGDITVRSNTQTAVLDDVKSPYIYGDKIQEIVRDLKADMLYPNDLRPEENNGYRTKYTKK